MCSHRVFLFSFPFCGWRCPFPGTCGLVQPMMVGSCEQEGSSILGGAQGRSALMWGDGPLLPPSLMEIQASTRCLHRAGDGRPPAARRAHPWRRPFPGADPVPMSCQRRRPQLSCSLLNRAPQPALAQVPPQSPRCKAWAQPPKPQPPALSQWPAGEEMLLLVPVAALPPAAFAWGRGMENIPPIDPRNHKSHPPPLPLQGVLGGLGPPAPGGASLRQPPT